jgi:hypothetical protein
MKPERKLTIDEIKKLRKDKQNKIDNKELIKK